MSHTRLLDSRGETNGPLVTTREQLGEKLRITERAGSASSPEIPRESTDALLDDRSPMCSDGTNTHVMISSTGGLDAI